MDNTEFEIVDAKEIEKNIPDIKRHNFDAAQNKLQKLSKKTVTNPKLDKVDTDGGLFGWFDHKVTGIELNSLTSKIQNYLVSLNETQGQFITEFKEVYKALEALDKDYIQAILIAIGENTVNNERIRKAQKDIDKNIKAQKATIDKLKELSDRIKKVEHFFQIDELWEKSEKIGKALNEFQREINGYKHLADIDSIWTKAKDIPEVKHDVASHNDRLLKIEQYKKELQGIPHLHEIGSIYDDVETLKGYKHLADIDTIWKNAEDVPQIHSDIKRHDTQLQNAEDYLNKLKALKYLMEVDSICDEVKNITDYLKVLKGYKHLMDIDSIWEKAENITGILDDIQKHTEQLKYFEEYRSGLVSISHLHDIDLIYDNLSETIAYLESLKKKEHLNEVDSIWNDVKDMKKRIDSANRKIIGAYTVAGISLATMLVGIVLQILKVI